MANDYIMKNVLAEEDAGAIAARGAFTRIIGYAVGIVANIISTSLLLHYFTVEDNGRYGTVFSILAIASGCAEAGMTVVGVREYVRQDENSRILMLRSLLGLRIVALVFGIAAATIFSIVQNYNSDMVGGVVFGGLGTLFILYALTFSIPLQASLRLVWVTVLDAVRQAGIAAFVIFVVLLKGSLFQALLAPVPVGMILLVLALAILRDRRLWLPLFNYEEWKRLLKLAGPVTIATTVGMLYFFLTQILMLAITTENEAGIYAASFRIFIALVAAPMLICSSFFPVLIHTDHVGDSDRFKSSAARLAQICLLLSGITAFTVASLAPLITDVLASEAFSRAEGVLVIHGFALAGTFLASCGGFSLLALGRNRAVMVVNAIGLLVNITAVLVLVKFDGARGAAYANLIGELALAAGYWIVLYFAGVRWNYKFMVRALVPSLLLFPLLFTSLSPVLKFSVGSFIFMVGTVLTGVVKPSMIRKFISRING